MFVYILKSTICLVLLLGFYHLVLEKEKMHQFNRFYLLGSVVFSLIVPSFIITVTPTEFVEPILTEQTFNQNIVHTTKEITPTQSIDYTNYILTSYILISTILFIIFGRKLFSILQKIRKNKKVNYFRATVVLLKEQVLPHTFLSYIFINKKEYQTESLEQQILTHELTHVEQKHTLDVLFIQVLQNLFWFNPIFRFYRKAIQLNHEFLADDAVINSHKNISEYQQLLLSKTAQNNNIYLASNFNYSLTKKRLLMMTTPSSKTKILLKKLLILPLTAGFIFAFAQRVEAQENKDLPQVVEVKKNNNGISDKEMKEYKRLITEAKGIKIFKQKDIIRMQNLYTRMSVKQQNSVEDIFKLLPPPPPVTHQKKTPSKLQFNSWKNKEKYALWIDGKVIDNSELNNYKNTDFSYFIGSKVHNNAKNKRFLNYFSFCFFCLFFYFYNLRFFFYFFYFNNFN
jgi:beta-lactamase regulating signal transducer with metallopeptidase domain